VTHQGCETGKLPCTIITTITLGAVNSTVDMLFQSPERIKFSITLGTAVAVVVTVIFIRSKREEEGGKKYSDKDKWHDDEIRVI
jgi:hypothetical protein